MPMITKPILIALAIAASGRILITGVAARHLLAQDSAKTSGLVVRVAVFSSDQGRLDDFRPFVTGHLFPALRTVPGYVSTFLGRDADSGQLISLSFWRSEGAAAAGEEAVGRTIRALPQGSAPRPIKVEKYVVEYRDVKEPFSK